MDFDFSKELVYGKKHLKILEGYDKEKYDFRKFARDCFNVDKLDEVHENNPEYDVFQEFGPDVNTWYHDTFYNYYRSENGPKMQVLYDNMITDVVLPYLGLTEAYVQKFPSFRVQLPNNLAVAKMHTDNSLGHPRGEINLMYAFTDMYDTNTVLIEKMPRSKEFARMEMVANNTISFNGNLCMHYNELNTTGKTRMSMDYRILPVNYYPKEESFSHSTKTKFVDGGYYKFIKLDM
jgi:hypothetical protein